LVLSKEKFVIFIAAAKAMVYLLFFPILFEVLLLFLHYLSNTASRYRKWIVELGSGTFRLEEGKKDGILSGSKNWL